MPDLPKWNLELAQAVYWKIVGCGHFRINEHGDFEAGMKLRKFIPVNRHWSDATKWSLLADAIDTPRKRSILKILQALHKPLPLTNLEVAAELRAWQLKHTLQPELADATN